MEIFLFFFLILCLALISPILIYAYWCYLALNFLEYKNNTTRLCVGLGLLRFFLGLTLGFFVLYLLLTNMPSETWGKPSWINRYLWLSILLSPVAALEWGIISFLIGKIIKKHNSKIQKYKIKNNLLWILGGTVISVFISAVYFFLIHQLLIS